MTKWFPIRITPLPSPRDFTMGFTLPAISSVYGFGVIQTMSGGKWNFTIDHRDYHDMSSVTHWMPLPNTI